MAINCYEDVQQHGLLQAEMYNLRLLDGVLLDFDGSSQETCVSAGQMGWHSVRIFIS